MSNGWERSHFCVLEFTLRETVVTGRTSGTVVATCQCVAVSFEIDTPPLYCGVN